MFGFGMPEMAIVAGIALIMFGPGKLPQLGQSLGAGIRNFKKASSGEDVVELNETEAKK